MLSARRLTGGQKKTFLCVLCASSKAGGELKIQNVSDHVYRIIAVLSQNQISSAIDSEKKDKMVDSAIEAEARFVSLLSCEDRIYRAGEVGRVK